jgi:hypothetical protein
MPPLDKMRKFRRDIVKSINEYRAMFKASAVFVDVLSNKAACDYAEYLLTADEDSKVLAEILNKHMIVGGV